MSAPEFANRVLNDAAERHASDVHFEPTADGYEIRFRLDGLLSTYQQIDHETGRTVVSRLMVMANLLTYRVGVPQEGRFAVPLESISASPTLRLAVMPTTHGMRAVVRLPAELSQPRDLETLGLPASVLDHLKRFAETDQGMLLFTGPAGSGKTTSIYALLEHIVSQRPGLSVISLEDPVERDLRHVTQIEIKPFGELSYESVLRSVLRQDPQVLVIGEIRDRETATIAIQAALTGHRLVSTLHAGTPVGAIARLLEMGVEPYQISNAIYGVVGQRLLRRCLSDGSYQGRFPIAEFAAMDESLRTTVLRNSDTASLGRCVEEQPGYRSLRDVAMDAVRDGVTDQSEIDRVCAAL